METLEIPASNHHVGSTERVFVAHVNDLNDFYLHSDSVRGPLGKLGQELYDEYSDSFTKPSEGNEVLNVGDYCACPSESEDWYRGLIRQLDPHGHAIVFKLDYGDVQCIPIHFLRPLKSRFFELHRLAFHCSLFNLIRPSDGWPLDVIGDFRSRLTTTFLYAKFVNYNEIKDMSEVEITEKTSKTPLNQDFEQYQIQRSTFQINDKHLYKHIPMEILDSNQLHQIRLLYYISPSRFYVYLKEKATAHLSFQIDLQQAMQNLRVISSPLQYQLVAVKDNQAIWHRAIVTNYNAEFSKLCVYFTDTGQQEYLPIENIRPLPEEFRLKPAFAIPCRLYKICPTNGNEQLIWTSNDPVHDEIHRLITNNVTCKVCAKQDQMCYDVQIDIPKVGDLGAFLCDKSLVTQAKMNQSQRPSYNSGQTQQYGFAKAQFALQGMSPSRPQQQQQQQQRPIQQPDYHNTQNSMIQQSQMRTSNTRPQNAPVQQAPSAPANISSSFNISTTIPTKGYYTITQVHSALEFYGLSQNREGDLNTLSKHLDDYYNNSINDQSLIVNSFDNDLYVVQQGDKYHRVTIKHRDNGSRVSVKLIDRGDEIIVDTSEFLKIDKQSSLVSPFAQPFRLHGYDESHCSANITRNLKKQILNQRVRIELTGSSINGFYLAEVFLPDNQSVNQLLRLNEPNLSIKSPSMNIKLNSLQSQHTPISSQVFNNSNRHHQSSGHDFNEGRSGMNQRVNNDLPAPRKILTAPPRMQPARFGETNPSYSTASSSNEATPRFSNVNNQSQQQAIYSTPSNSTWTNDQNTKPSFGGNNMTSRQSGSSQYDSNQRTDDNRMSMTNNQNRFSSMNSGNQMASSEQKRSGYTYDKDNEKQTSGNTFQQNNVRTNENDYQRGGFSSRGGFSNQGSAVSDRESGGGDRRGGVGDRGNGFSNRGNSFGDRGGHSGFANRNMDRSNEDNNNGHNPQSSEGFSRRPGGFADRGGRGGYSQDRSNINRNQGDDNNENGTQRSQHFSSNRGGRGGGGGFPNRREGGNDNESGDFGRRGGFSARGGDQRGGGFRGGRGGGGGFRDQDNSRLQLSSDNSASTNNNNTWSSMRPTTVNFESGDRLLENEIPKDAFKFVISHIETANDFFIQLLSKGADLTKLTDVLQTEYKQTPVMNLSSFKQNQPCLAKSSDQCWYRAVVLSTGLSKLKVHFIDFGDTTEVDSNSIRPLAKKYCSVTPYAYRCTFKNVEVIKNISTESIVNKCAEVEYNGNIEAKNSDGTFTLESNDFRNLLLEINAIKLKSEVTLKRIKCRIAHIEPTQQQFYVQDENTIEKIDEHIEKEDENAPTLSLEEVKQLEANTILIARFDDEPYRAIIQSDQSDDDVNVCFIDFGNISSCPKTSLKRCSEQLSSFPHQSKQCQLYGITPNEMDKALEYLQEHSDSETAEIAIINQTDRSSNVLVYFDNECMNEKFGYDPNVSEKNDTSEENDEQSSTTTATTVKEQEQSPSVVEHQVDDDVSSPNEDTSPVVIPEQNKVEIEEASSKYRQGLLTHLEQTKPCVYLQLIPESDEKLGQINELIKAITDEDKHNSSYEIGDHVIAQFSEDDDYYRARIESYSDSSKLYTVYFLDYGNIDENVPVEHLYSYSNELEQIEPQVHGYLLHEITSETWTDIVRSMVEKKLNDVIEFYITDEHTFTIHMKFDDENGPDPANEDTEVVLSSSSSAAEQIKTFTANICATDSDCFYIHVIPEGNLHVGEIEEMLRSCKKVPKDQWAINELCIVSNEDNQYYRGQILCMDDNKYDVKRIDYGNTLPNVSNEHLLVLPHEDVYEQPPLAYQCRLSGIDDLNQVKAIEDIIGTIQGTEHVTITVENDRNDPCLFVTLIRENQEVVNNLYLDDGNDRKENDNKQESDNDDEKDPIILPDSVPTIDVPTMNTDEELTSKVEASENESMNKTVLGENQTLSSTWNNQTIDFGENDRSTIIESEPIHSTASD